MAAKKIGGISVAIVAETAKFMKNMAGAQGALRRFASGAANALKTFVKFSAAIGAAGAAGLVYFTKSAADSVDALAKTADKLGITTEALAGLQLATGEAGIEQEVLNKALTTLVKNTSMAASGVGSAAKAYQELGLDARTLNDMSPDQQLMAIADAMSNVRSKQDQLRIATQLFGAKAALMINVLRAGKGPLEEAAQAAKDLGLAVDRESAAGVERAIDAWERFKLAIQGIFRQIAVTVAPVIELISKKLVSFMSEGGRGAKFGQGIGKFVVEVFKKIGDGFQAVISGFLELIADFKLGLMNFRLSNLGKDFGLGYDSFKDAEAANLGVYNARQRANDFARLPLFSEQIDSLIKESKSRRNSPEGDGFTSFAQGIGDAIADKLKPIARTASNFGVAGNNALVGARDAALKFLGLGIPQLLGQKAAMDIANGNKPGQTPALAFAESGTADSYRQQAAIRRQNESQKLDKTRNTLLAEIRDDLRKKPGLLIARAG